MEISLILSSPGWSRWGCGVPSWWGRGSGASLSLGGLELPGVGLAERTGGARNVFGLKLWEGLAVVLNRG